MTLRTLSLTVDSTVGSNFWSALCQEMLGVPTRPPQSSSETWNLSHLQVVVTSHTHTNALFKAFGAIAAAQSRSLIPPRIRLLKDWMTDWEMAVRDNHAYAPPASANPLQVQSEIYLALRSNAWICENFGKTPIQLWNLAHTLTQLCNQLCFAAHQQPDDFSATLEHTILAHYQKNAQQMVAAEARIVLDIWKALGTFWPASQQLQQLQTILQHQSTTPLPPLWWISPQALPSWQAAFLEQLSHTTEITCVTVDYQRTLALTPVYAASWSQLIAASGKETLPTVPTLHARAHALPPQPTPPLTLQTATTLEQEAQGIATQVVQWLAEGETEIALVALDRLTTRRVRALLERAQVLARDETGWRLSTTSACGAVMRWFDVVRNQGYFRDVMDWLQSPFVLPQQDKHAALRLLQTGLAQQGVVRGWKNLSRMLSQMPETTQDAGPLQQLRSWFLELQRQAQQFEHFSGNVSEHLARLYSVLDHFGLRESLACDPVGRSVLQQLQQLGQALQTHNACLQLSEFRALLAHCFEQANDRQETIDSPVTIVSLRGAHLRTFRKVIVIGANADLLPAAAPEMLFLGDALCTTLGLPTQAQERAEQFNCWLTLLTGAQQIIATWRNDPEREPQILSPWLAQYRTVVQLSQRQDIMRPMTLTSHTVMAQPRLQPRPQAPDYWPASVSASRYQALIDCPYRYFARSILGLQIEETVSETAEQRERGQAIHQILENFHRTLAQQPSAYLTMEARRALLTQLTQTTFAPLLERAPDFLAYQMEFAHLIPDYLNWLETHQAEGWQWHRAEARLHCTLTSADRPLSLQGRIDRMDIQIDPSDEKIALIDYKITAADTLKKRLKTAGEEIQLPFYALLAQAPDCSASYLALQRGKVQELTPAYEMGTASRTLATRLLQDFVRIHAGAPMPAHGDERTCTFCEMRGLCRRDEWLTESTENT